MSWTPKTAVGPIDPFKARAFEDHLVATHPLLIDRVRSELSDFAEAAVRPVHAAPSLPTTTSTTTSPSSSSSSSSITAGTPLRVFGSNVEPPAAIRAVAYNGIVDVDALGFFGPGDKNDNVGTGSSSSKTSPTPLPTLSATDLIEVAKLRDSDAKIEITLLAKPTFTPSTCAGDKLVRGFNGLPGLGPWAIAGYIRVRSLVESARAVELPGVASISLRGIMSGRRTIAKAGEAFVPINDFHANLCSPPSAVLVGGGAGGGGMTPGPGGECYRTFGFRFTQVYPPTLDLASHCSHETANTVAYRLSALAEARLGNVTFSHDVPVQLVTADAIRAWHLHPAVLAPAERLFATPSTPSPPSHPSAAPIPPVRIRAGPHAWCVPNETLNVSITLLRPPPGYSPPLGDAAAKNDTAAAPAADLAALFARVAYVKLTLVELVGFPDGAARAALRRRLTAKTCAVAVATRENLPPSSSSSSSSSSQSKQPPAAAVQRQTLVWAAAPASDGDGGGATATLTLKVPPPPPAPGGGVGGVVFGGSPPAHAVRRGGNDWTRTYPDVPSGSVNTDGRWMHTIVAHEVCAEIGFLRGGGGGFGDAVGWLRAGPGGVEVPVVAAPSPAPSALIGVPGLHGGPGGAGKRPAALQLWPKTSGPTSPSSSLASLFGGSGGSILAYEYRVPVTVVGVPRGAAVAIARRFPVVLEKPEAAERAPPVARRPGVDPPMVPAFEEHAILPNSPEYMKYVGSV
ncbi:hypothetical protein DFJ73DRAFT_772732 [Zopfochytrium polystomum]|nr:hypothetical protein DFJ73DRAFT_772732 [Zopfochytrium polystomum]